MLFECTMANAEDETMIIIINKTNVMRIRYIYDNKLVFFRIVSEPFINMAVIINTDRGKKNCHLHG